MTMPSSFETYMRLFECIAETPGKNDKIIHLGRYMALDSGFCTLLNYMLNPFITYGVLDFPPSVEPVVPATTFQALTDLLDRLAAREITGHEAKASCSALVAGGLPRELLLRILNKDPKAGFGINSVNEVCPGFLPKQPYMRCSLPETSNLDDFDWEGGVFSQLKADGMFVNINKSLEGDIQISSRQGMQMPLVELQDLVEQAEQYLAVGSQTHGELLVTEAGMVLPRHIGNGILNSVAQGGELGVGRVVRCQVWDQIPLEEAKAKGRYDSPYTTRFGVLREQVKLARPWILQMVPSRIVHSRKAAYDHYYEVIGQGLEGTVVKSRSAIWRDGTSKDQVKLKPTATGEFKVVGFRPGKGKNEKSFGAVVVQTEDGLLEVGVGVSTMTEKERDYIWKEKDSVIGAVMSVTYCTISKPSPSNKLHSLGNPRFEELRRDKDQADTLQETFDQFNATISGAAR